MQYDYCIIGAGIVGLSTAMQLMQRFPDASIVVVERNSGPAEFQTGRNSGVIHAGVYYAPGSLKARFCRAGLKATIAFCKQHDIAYEQCGKLIVATDDIEVERLGALTQRVQQNGIASERLNAVALQQREPHISGVGALLVPDTGIVSYREISLGMARVFAGLGGEIRYDSKCMSIHEQQDGVSVETTTGTIQTRWLIACAGVQADRIARQAGLELDFSIVPFRGDYYRLPSEKNDIVSHLIYPVPDPSLPFLGVHLTRMIGGYVTVGPNAALSFARERYGPFAVNLRDAFDLARQKSTWKMLWQHRHSAISEVRSALVKRRYLALCQKYCPSLRIDDLLPHPSGIRAQAVGKDGALLHDFLIQKTRRTIHICNAPSPAATAALPIGDHIVTAILEHQEARS